MFVRRCSLNDFPCVLVIEEFCVEEFLHTLIHLQLFPFKWHSQETTHKSPSTNPAVSLPTRLDPALLQLLQPTSPGPLQILLILRCRSSKVLEDMIPSSPMTPRRPSRVANRTSGMMISGAVVVGTREPIRLV